jgi:hypothetical protein
LLGSGVLVAVAGVAAVVVGAAAWLMSAAPDAAVHTAARWVRARSSPRWRRVVLDRVDAGWVWVGVDWRRAVVEGVLWWAVGVAAGAGVIGVVGVVALLGARGLGRFGVVVLVAAELMLGLPGLPGLAHGDPATR